jgi:hypothetical protein
MSDPVELAEKKSGKSKNSKVSKKSNEQPQASAEKNEIKSQQSHNSKVSKNSKNSQVINNKENKESKEEITEKVETKIEETQPEPQAEAQQPVISVRAYLEQNVTSVVQEALLEVARKRPPNPLQFVGNYILERANGQ